MERKELLIEWERSPKQKQAFEILTDKTTTELLYGGGAGGAKSYLGCAWIIYMCLRYPGIRALMGRAHLKDLKNSTLLTLFTICKDWGLKKDIEYTYNSSAGIIKWFNGSEVYLKDLFAYPSDPEFDSLGSTEYTIGFIDEASEVTKKAKNILMSRLRYKLDEFDLVPKLLIATNPCKHWAYYDFYKPYIEKTLTNYMRFVPALVTDNPFISKHYIANLNKLDEVSKQRLLYGNWEYDDDPARLFEYESIIDMFTNNASKGTKYCIVDVAGRGRDKTVIILWNGFFIYKVILMDNISNSELDEILTEEGIPRSKCLVDEDGVGFGLVKDTPGVKGFVNNSKPLQSLDKSKDEIKETTNYRNLKTQCWFELADYVNRGKIGVYRNIELETKKLIIEDLEQIKQKNIGKDQPLQVLTKEEIKEVLGRSTDCGDCLLGNTKILTTKGYKFIRDIKKGEKVITPYGNRIVLETKRKKTKELMRIRFNNGNEIYCTKNHKLFLNNKFIKVKNLMLREYKGELFNLKDLLKWRIKRLFTKEKDIGFYPLEDIIIKKEMEKSKHYIEEFMKIQQEDKLVKEKKYTILMETISTILQKILWKFKRKNIEESIYHKDSKMLRKSVFSVIKNLLIKVCNNVENTARINAFKNTNINKRDILRKEIVYTAGKNLMLKNKTKPNVVQEVVLLTFGEEIDVYDLKVQKDHCYYANNILVSNCLMMRMWFELKGEGGTVLFLDLKKK